MQLDWDDIRVFLAVERTGRLSQAARRLGVSHTTVARRLKHMEERAGVRLFDVTDEGLALTEAGTLILTPARDMEEAATALSDTLGRFGQSASERVRVGAPDGFGNSILSKLLPELIRLHPECDVELVPVPVTHKLWRRDVDIAITLERPETGRTMVRKLMDYDLRLYAAPGFFKDGLPTVREDLRTYPFVGYIDELLYTTQLDFNRFILPDLRVAYKAATVKAQFDAVSNGIGLGVLPCFIAQDSDLVPVLPDQIAFGRTYWLLFPEEYRTLERIRRVSTFIHEQTQALAPRFRYVPPSSKA